MNTRKPEVDVAIVGAGVAGLAGALTLVRARRSVLVVDAGQPRNAPAAHTHGFLTRDGIPPRELVATGRREVAGYGGELVDGAVTAIERRGEQGFEIDLADGRARTARRVLLATGLVDDLPDIPGIGDRWGRDVVHCPYCFGWEVRDRRLGVLGGQRDPVAQALLWRQWSAHVVILLHTAGEPEARQLATLGRRGIDVVRGEVVGLEVVDDRLRGVRLASGGQVELEVLVVGSAMRARHELLDPLGVAVVEHPMGIGTQVQVDQTGATSAAGIWAAGNVADVAAGLMQAAASGVTAAASINADLTAEDGA